MTALQELLQRQRASSAQRPVPDIQWRLDRIDKLVNLLVEHQQPLCDALNADFGCRGEITSKMAEFVPPIRHAAYVRRNLRKWMKPEVKRPDFPYGHLGGKARIECQPLGVVGVVVPWNGPVGMAIIGAIDALSAGNRVMVKLSENAPTSSGLLAELALKYFDPADVAFITGGADVAHEFCRLPLDHILFTGGGNIGKDVLIAAAENLVPVTLELGGKCPAIVGHDADVAEAAVQIIHGRLINGGQACIAPDYAFVPTSKLDQFLTAAVATVSQAYPTIVGNADYTSIINERHFHRIAGYVAEAKAAQCNVVEIAPQIETLPDAERRLIAPTIIVNPSEDLRIFREETFGPVLLVFTYDKLQDAILAINSRPHPLAVYYFGKNNKDKRYVLSNTVSGGVTINGVLLHLLMSNLPFGGVGPSGFGRYWGGDSGFKRFSNPRSIFEQGRFDMLGRFFRPPYGSATQAILSSTIRSRRGN